MSCSTFYVVSFYTPKRKKKPLHLHFYYKEIRGDHLFLGGGGAVKFGREKLFIFSLSLAGNFIFRYTKARIFIFISNKILKKKEQKKKKQTKDERGGGVLKRETRQDFPCDLFDFEGYRYVHAVCM